MVTKRTRWLMLVAASGLIFRIAWSTWVRPNLAFALLPGCLDLFAAGAILRHVEQLPVVRRLARFQWVMLAWLVWAALWAAFYLTGLHYAWLLVYASAGCLPAAFTLNWALHQATRPAAENRLLTALRWVGQRSYGCYLYHLLLPVFYQRAVFRLFPATSNYGASLRAFWMSPAMMAVVLLPLLLLMAAASWRWLEAPLNRWKERLAYT